jgi:DNA-directed RNA polymerase specialized sigma24 family protein
MRHRTIDYLRAVSRGFSLQVFKWEESEQDDRVVLPDAWEEARISILSTQVRAALLTLAMEDRRLIELAYFHGCILCAEVERVGLEKSMDCQCSNVFLHEIPL